MRRNAMKRQDYVPNHSFAPGLCAKFCFCVFLFVACNPARAEVIEAWVQRDKASNFRFASGNAVTFDRLGKS